MALDDLNDHPFAIHAAAEAAGLDDTAWERWTARAEKILGHSLDGNQELDGYSLDFAFDAFKAGTSAEDYAASIAGLAAARP